MFNELFAFGKAIVWTAAAILSTLGLIVLAYHGEEALEYYGLWEPLLADLGIWWPEWLIVFVFVAFLRHICVQRPIDRARRARRQGRAERRNPGNR